MLHKLRCCLSLGFKKITDTAKWFIGGCPSTTSLQPYRYLALNTHISIFIISTYIMYTDLFHIVSYLLHLNGQ